MAYKTYKFLPKCTNAEPSDTYPLSPEQLSFYEDNGYLVIKNLIAPSALNTYREHFVDICNSQAKTVLFSVVKDHSLYRPDAKPEEYINKIQQLLYDDVFSTYTENPRLMNTIAQLIGDDITALNCMVINKPPGTKEHPVHQDLIYFPIRPAHKIIVSWTAIDPVSKDNGCLFVVPGSHKCKELYEHVGQKDLFYQILGGETIATEEKKVNLEMEPGDTVFFSPLLLHGSRPNVTKIYRKCITSYYANSNCYYIDVTGTNQEVLANPVKLAIAAKGGDLSLIDVFKVTSKQIRGVRSNL